MRTAYQIWLFDTSITKQELQFKEDTTFESESTTICLFRILVVEVFSQCCNKRTGGHVLIKVLVNMALKSIYCRNIGRRCRIQGSSCEIPGIRYKWSGIEVGGFGNIIIGENYFLIILWKYLNCNIKRVTIKKECKREERTHRWKNI